MSYFLEMVAIKIMIHIPEANICKELNIKLIDGLGDKIQSSSWLLKNKND